MTPLEEAKTIEMDKDKAKVRAGAGKDGAAPEKAAASEVQKAESPEAANGGGDVI